MDRYWLKVDINIFMIFENAFASLSYMTVADLLQLSPVKKVIILKYFDRDSMTHF